MPNSSTASRPGKEVQSQRLLDSAIYLIGRKGTDLVSVAEICEHAGLSRDTFYRCFADKNDLVIKLYSSNMAAYINQAQELVLRRDMGIEGMQGFIGEGIDYLLDMGPMALTLMVDAKRSGSPARAITEQGKVVLVDTITHWAEETFSVTPERELIITVMSSIETLLQQLLESENYSLANIQKTKDIAWKLVCGIFLVEACQNDKLVLNVMNDDSGGAISSSMEMIARSLNQNQKKPG